MSEADAASVFAIGDFEYEWVLPPFPLLVLFFSFFSVAGPLSRLLMCIQYAATSGMRHKTRRRTIRLHLVKRARYSACFRAFDPPTPTGAFFAELADALAVPAVAHRFALYVGHDGSLVRLLAGLGAVPLRWPSFGAEVVFEVRSRV